MVRWNSKYDPDNCPGEFIFIDKANNKKVKIECMLCYGCKHYTFRTGKQGKPPESDSINCKYFISRN